MLPEVEGVEVVQEIARAFLRRFGQGTRGLKMGHGRAGGAELGALVRGGQPAAGPHELAIGVVARRIAQDDVGGEVPALAAERVADPRTHRGATVEDLAGLHRVEGKGMVVVVRVHGAHEAEIIRASGEVRDQLGQFHAALSVA